MCPQTKPTGLPPQSPLSKELTETNILCVILGRQDNPIFTSQLSSSEVRIVLIMPWTDQSTFSTIPLLFELPTGLFSRIVRNPPFHPPQIAPRLNQARQRGLIVCFFSMMSPNSRPSLNHAKSLARTNPFHPSTSSAPRWRLSTRSASVPPSFSSPMNRPSTHGRSATILLFSSASDAVPAPASERTMGHLMFDSFWFAKSTRTMLACRLSSPEPSLLFRVMFSPRSSSLLDTSS